jgi:muramoyltetrapeptide carboxypeptidase LdcA involved in peptidoglycan recycling
MIKPAMLQPGDKVATVTSSWGGPATVPNRYAAGKKQLEDEFGLQVVEMPYTLKSAEWVYANPKARAEDLMAAFADPTIKGIISTIGGDDSIRMLPYIDLDVIRANPKVYLGYSDSTITHMICHKVGLTSFYGPSILSGFAESGGMFPYMVESVHKTLFSTDAPGIIAPNTAGWTVEKTDWNDSDYQHKQRKLNPSTGWRWLQGDGAYRGPLIGGCIEVLDWLRGTDFWPDSHHWDGAILFLEASEDMPSPDAVWLYLRTYAALGILQKLSGILYARPGGQIAPDKFEEYDEVLMQVVAIEEGLTHLPIVTNVDFGHTDPMLVLPYGTTAEIDCIKQQFSILESGVA